jgi:signal transduction histidine kinase
LASNTITAIDEGPAGTMWFGTPDGLSELSSGRFQRYTTRDGLPPGGVNCLSIDSTGVLWIGTAQGLAFLRSGRIKTFRDVPGPLREEMLGIAEDRNGWLWMATTKHILRAKRQKLLEGALDVGDLREYAIGDGLLGNEGVKRHRSVVSDASGHVWFSTNRGISNVDPALLTNDSAPAIVHIQTISADGHPVPLSGSFQVSPGRKRISFGYVGLLLSSPERLRFRYRLDGFDRDWTEPVAVREAVYTNLGPGSYRFHLVASNREGIWNGAETALGFQIDPAFWQTWWFRLISGLACTFLVTAVYRFRMNQISNRLKFSFEERLRERTRIAQELHDTLLQGFLSASMQVHVASGRLSENSPATAPLSRAIQLMEQASHEGRNALRGLRTSETDSLNLEQAFSSIRQELAISEEIRFRVIVQGQRQPLQPALRDDVYRIGREALINAFRHSHAKNIEVELNYALNEFRLFVRDDGCGIDPHTVQSGREGHWGLTGMRERAERIGVKLSVWSGASTGTEVVLLAASRIAFQSPAPHGLLRWVRGRFWRTLRQESLEVGKERPL